MVIYDDTGRDRRVLAIAVHQVSNAQRQSLS
jgi:hypothetical protein